MKTNFLTHINSPSDLRLLTAKDLPFVAKELREFIIDIVATKEGHLGASLGVVELTIALHYVFQTPIDNLIWDVGHQAYGHKILTGRKDVFHTNRQFKGIAGFPNRSESEYDAFGTGHSSTSISAALGMAMAASLKGETSKQHIAVIGDASIASGMAFEGLNHAGVSKANLLIVLNDNEMGIDPNVGALKEYLSGIKKEDKARERNLFEAFNFAYSGPIDGHDLPALIAALTSLKKVEGPKFLHVITTKGKGLEKAEKDQVTYHAPGKFDKITGEIFPKNTAHLPPKYQDVFGETILELAEKNEKIVGITPAMPTGSSLKIMIEAMPERAFDVGIAEQHAVTLSAGMATEGMLPFCTIYSTFLQRAYDQIIHDVALQNLPVIFCLDRAGLVGEDGATHHGVFDIAYLRCIPNLCVFAPMNVLELRNIMYTAQLGLGFPIAIRYPRGRGELVDWKCDFEEIEIAKAIQISEGTEVAVLTVGPIGNTVVKVFDKINSSRLAHYNMRFIKPLDEKLLHHICKTFKKIVTIEDGTVVGGFGTSILEFVSDNNYLIPVERKGVPDQFIEHGSTELLYESIGLSEAALTDYFNQLNY
ncbi:MAG: 1-deoxy-D-xylulose-5-phosphate synthase [Flavobacteriaceae bacterium]|nr:MAG: 1-deoxy-D-xylulose-5-phosphate synthase [Flavobacteriaceae bacterium]